jgi:hypothetical protein
MLPQARHNDKVLAYGWKSVEKNVWQVASTSLIFTNNI